METGLQNTNSSKTYPLKLALSLNDLIGLHYKQVDLVHKLWNYLWLAGAAVITVTANKPTVGIYLVFGFLLFAAANAHLVNSAQREAYLSSIALKAEINQVAVSAEVRDVILAIDPWPAKRVLIGHIMMSAFVVIALIILMR